MWMGTMQDDSRVSWFPRQPIRYGILTQLVARLDSIILVRMRSMWVTPVANGKARTINKSFGLLTGYTSPKSRDMIHHAGLMIIWKGSILQGRIEITWGIRLKPRKWQPLRLGVSPIYKICGHGARASGFHGLSAEINGYPSEKCLSWSQKIGFTYSLESWISWKPDVIVPTPIVSRLPWKKVSQNLPSRSENDFTYRCGSSILPTHPRCWPLHIHLGLSVVVCLCISKAVWLFWWWAWVSTISSIYVLLLLSDMKQLD